MRADDLDFAARQMVELQRRLPLRTCERSFWSSCFDEPHRLAAAEIDVLFARVRALKCARIFIFVSHRLEKSWSSSDRIYVMKDGAVVADLVARDANITTLHHLHGGPEPAGRVLPRTATEGIFRKRSCWKLTSFPSATPIKTFSFKLHPGEILGIAGVIGSGREGTGPYSGGLRAPQRRQAPRCQSGGASYVTRRSGGHWALATFRASGGSKAWCCFCQLPPTLPWRILRNLTRHGLIDAREERRLATSWVERLKIRTPNINTLCLNLFRREPAESGSGEMADAKARILILDHPTRGLDVGAKKRFMIWLRAVTTEGVAVILTSDTLRKPSASATRCW